MTFKLQLREDRPATIEEHADLRAEIALLHKLLRMTPILVINREAAAVLNESEALVYADAVKAWHARVKEVIG